MLEYCAVATTFSARIALSPRCREQFGVQNVLLPQCRDVQPLEGLIEVAAGPRFRASAGWPNAAMVLFASRGKVAAVGLATLPAKSCSLPPPCHSFSRRADVE